VIALRRVGTLDVSAASGLAGEDGLLYVAADDELSLLVCREDGARVRRIALRPGALPEGHEARKRAKPDLECAVFVAPGVLLVLGSGSTDGRMRGFAVDVRPGSGGVAREVDLAPLYRELRRRFPELNVEGAAACGDALRLLQRGNGPAGVNAVVDLDLAGVRAALASGGRALDASLVRAVVRVDLGSLRGVRLGFTDASTLADGALLFSAAAEASADTFHDGPCAGSVLGALDARGGVLWMEPLAGTLKIEGVHVTAAAPGRAFLADDPDDRSRRSTLLEARLPE
jgi:hypothetical protein